MKMKFDRIISIATLVASLVAITLVLRRPAPVVQQPAASASAPHSDSADHKAPQASQNTQAGDSGGESSPYEPSPYGSSDISQAAPSQSNSQSTAQAAPSATSSAASGSSGLPNADGLSAMIAKTLGGAGAASLSPESNVGSGEPNIKDQQVTMDGDVVHGKFLTEIGGKDVWVTISGHMGQKDGYATFDPTEFKIGDKEIPVSLVNPLLQQKMAEERDKLKIPNN